MRKRFSPFVSYRFPYKSLSDIINTILFFLWIVDRLEVCEMTREEIASINPYEYEELVANYLRSCGYTKVQTTPKSGDYGADVIAVSPEGKKVCIQCKRFQGSVGVKAVQEIFSAKSYYNCELAFVYTTGEYTQQAYELAKKTGVELFVYLPDESQSKRPYIFNPKPIKAKKKYTKKNRPSGCMIVFLLCVAFIVGLTLLVEHDEEQSREEKNTLIATAENRDVESSQNAPATNETETQSEIPSSVIIDGVCYEKVDDHFEVVGLADYQRTAITIKDYIDSIPVTVIKKNAFHEESVQSVYLPDTINEIGYGAFSSCRSLMSINIPITLEEIESNTFILCESLTGITLPATVTKIQSSAFCGTGISSINLENVTFIGDNAFDGCSSLSAVTFSPQLTEIGDRAFTYCDLRSVDIPEGVTSIGTSCFDGCKRLSYIKLPESLTSIGNRCFQNCEALTEIRIPSNVTNLKDGQMFLGDTALQVIYVSINCKIPRGSEPFIMCNARIVYY